MNKKTDWYSVLGILCLVILVVLLILTCMSAAQATLYIKHRAVNNTQVNNVLLQIPEQYFHGVDSIYFTNRTKYTDTGEMILGEDSIVREYLLPMRTIFRVRESKITIYADAYTTDILLYCTILHELGHNNEAQNSIGTNYKELSEPYAEDWAVKHGCYE